MNKRTEHNILTLSSRPSPRVLHSGQRSLRWSTHLRFLPTLLKSPLVRRPHCLFTALTADPRHSSLEMKVFAYFVAFALVAASSVEAYAHIGNHHRRGPSATIAPPSNPTPPPGKYVSH